MTERFNISVSRVLWKNKSGTIQAASFFDGTSRLFYFQKLRDERGLNLDVPEHLFILSASDMLEIGLEIERDAHRTIKYKNQNDAGLPF